MKWNEKSSQKWKDENCAPTVVNMTKKKEQKNEIKKLLNVSNVIETVNLLCRWQKIENRDMLHTIM